MIIRVILFIKWKWLGPSSANFTAEFQCSDQSLLVSAMPQAECTNLASASNCSVTVTIRSSTSYLSEQSFTCTIRAVMLQRYGDESYCWSAVGKQYAQEISLIFPLLTAPGSNDNNLGGFFGIGEVIFIFKQNKHRILTYYIAYQFIHDSNF